LENVSQQRILQREPPPFLKKEKQTSKENKRCELLAFMLSEESRVFFFANTHVIPRLNTGSHGFVKNQNDGSVYIGSFRK
jgi:hypothetical protein